MCIDSPDSPLPPCPLHSCWPCCCEPSACTFRTWELPQTAGCPDPLSTLAWGTAVPPPSVVAGLASSSSSADAAAAAQPSCSGDGNVTTGVASRPILVFSSVFDWLLVFVLLSVSMMVLGVFLLFSEHSAACQEVF